MAIVPLNISSEIKCNGKIIRRDFPLFRKVADYIQISVEFDKPVKNVTGDIVRSAVRREYRYQV